MEAIRIIRLNNELKQIAQHCYKRLNKGNYKLVERLFKSKVKNLYKKEFKDKYEQYVPLRIEGIFSDYCKRYSSKEGLIE